MSRPRTPLQAVAAAINAAGWRNMAAQYLRDPDKRERIAAMVARDIERRFGAEKARRFAQLEARARRIS